ncbi:hypothetical protein FQA39_LY01873 [Lamprigera yunnana]|nr:hypothetical protein FQA39_LY01873 [Lamprigera yunnana]
MLLFCILIVVLIIFIYFKAYVPLQYWKEKGIPYENPNLIFGNLTPAVLKKTTVRDLIETVCKKFEGHRYFGFYQLSAPSLVVLDPELIKDICIKSFDSFTDHTDFLPKSADPFWKKTLLSRDGEDWHEMRSILSPTFTSRKMKAMFNIVVQCSERFVNHFAKQKGVVTVEVMDAFTKFTNDVTTTCTLGLDCDSFKDERNEFYLNGKEAFDFTGWKVIRFFGNSLSPALVTLLGVKFFNSKVRNFFIRITKEVINYREENNIVRPDVIHLLKEAQKGRSTYEKDEDLHDSGFASIQEASILHTHSDLRNSKLSDDDVAAQISIFFFGTSDTVSIVLSHITYELVVHMDIQKKLMDEIDTTLSDNNGKITYEAVSKMKYLDMVVSETLRLWPPAFFLNRKCVKPYTIEPKIPNETAFVVEPDTTIIIPAIALHHNPKYFKDPYKFDPERFNDENKTNINQYTYLPFGIGPRHCIGNRFALMIMKIIMVTILSRFEIVRVEKTVIPFEPTFVPLQYWKEKGIPYENPTPIFGNLTPAVLKMTTVRKLIETVCKKFEGHRYFGFYQFSTPSLVVLDPELIKDICIKSFDSFTDHTDFLPKSADPFCKKTLLARDGEDWHEMRSILSPTFTSRKMKAMFNIVAQCSERFVNHFAKQDGVVTLEVMDAFTKFTNDVTTTCTLGLDCDSLEDERNEFYLIGKEAFDFTGWKVIRFFGNSLSPALVTLLGVKFFNSKVRNFFMRITKEVINYREKNNIVRPDVIHLLKEAQKGRLTYEKDEDGHDSGFASIQEASVLQTHSDLSKSKLSDEDIAAQIIVFFFGASDTVSIVLSHMTYELVVHVDIQKKLTNEIDTILSEKNGKFTYEAMCKMKYLDMVISETLRVWPPPFLLNRKCVKPYTIEPKIPNETAFVVEPGTDIIIPVIALHNNQKYFKDPHTFDPERFNDENKTNINQYSYLPFGIGPRHCIGNRFALMIMKIIMVTILSRFEIVRVEKTVIPFEPNKNTHMLRSAHGYWFGLKSRTLQFKGK